MKLSFKNLIASCKDDFKVAFRFHGATEITYDSFYKDCINVAEKLKTIAGNNVMICNPYSYKWIIFYFGALLADKTAVLPPDNITSEDLLKLCDRYRISYVIHGDSSSSTVRIIPAINSSHAISTVIFTSGTEGFPKGVALSEKGLLCSVYYSVQRLGLNETDIVIHTLPFSHAFGLAAEIIAVIMSKATLCFGKKLGMLPIDISTFKPTVMFSVPAVLKGILPYIDNNTSLRKVISGSASFDVEIIDNLPESVTAFYSYGLSECSPVVALSSQDDAFERFYSGRPLPCCIVSIADDGEICISGDNVMLGYFDGSALDKSTIVNGELHTGDLGYVSNNKLYVTGRKKNILAFSNGIKMSTEDLEQKIIISTGVRDCIVFQNDSKSVNVILQTESSADLLNNNVAMSLPFGISLRSLSVCAEPFEVTSTGKKIRHNYQPT